MMRRLIASCIAGILLGMVVVSLPLTAMVYRTETTVEQRAFDSGTGESETRDFFGVSYLGTAIGIGLILSLSLLLASSVFILLKRTITRQ